MSSRVVIVGAGQAGCQAAVSLREKEFTGQITLLSGESVLPYQRPPLSKAFLLGKASAADIAIRAETYFRDKGIQLCKQTPVSTIDRGKRVVVTRGGLELPYDHLVLATGVRNRRLNIVGEDLKGVFSLRTVEDAQAIRFALRHASRLAILGAGFIGMEVAAVAAQLGLKVTVIERAERAMGRTISAPIAEYLVRRHQAGGVKFEFDAGVEVLEGNVDRAVRSVNLIDGRSVDADMVLVAVGVAPSVELAQATGLATENGVIVDAALRTSDPDIFAIGDCANALHDLYPGQRVRLESIQNANDQARCVAAILTGTPMAYGSVPWFWSDQWDLKLQIAGLSAPEDHSVHRGDPQTGKFSIARLREGQLTAVESINHTSDHMAARSLLRKNSTIDPTKVGDDSLPLRALGA